MKRRRTAERTTRLDKKGSAKGTSTLNISNELLMNKLREHAFLAVKTLLSHLGSLSSYLPGFRVDLQPFSPTGVRTNL